MAEFCSLCGYGDFDIHEIYDEHVKPLVVKKELDNLEDGKQLLMGGFFVCESCGLISVGFDKQYDVYGIYFDDDKTNKVKIGYVDKTTFDFIFDEEISPHKENRIKADEEAEIFMKQWEEFQKETTDIMYELYCDNEKDVVTYEEFDFRDEKYEEYFQKARDIIYEKNNSDSN